LMPHPPVAGCSTPADADDDAFRAGMTTPAGFRLTSVYHTDRPQYYDDGLID